MTSIECVARPVRDISVRPVSLVESTCATEEQQVFAVLRDCVTQRGLDVVCRVAGGWVRDWILGRKSHDLDIALDTMTGQQFAEILNEFMSQGGIKTHRIGTCGYVVYHI